MLTSRPVIVDNENNSHLHIEVRTHTMVLRLSDLKPGERVKLLDFDSGDVLYKRRLMEIGLTPGVEFTVSHIAPFGDPFIIKTEQTSICLRKKEASIFILEKLESL